MTKSWLITSVMCAAFFAAQAQVDRDGEPLSWNILQQLPTSSIWNALPEVDHALLIAEDAAAFEDKSTPLRFAKSSLVDYSNLNSGRWTNLNNGDRIWMLGIESQGAFSIGLSFSNFDLPQGASIFVYTENHTDYIGPLTLADNKLGQIMTLPPVHGDKIIIEYYEPYAYRGQGEFNISSVAHGYRDLKDQTILEQNNCMIPFTGSTSATRLNNASSSVLMMIVDNGQRIATSALINNSSNDGTPYVFAAESALIGAPSSWLFLFDVVGSGCYNANTVCWNRAICGAQVVHTDEVHGISLLRLKNTPKKTWSAFYSGWQLGEVEGEVKINCIQNAFGLPQTVSTYNGILQNEIWNDWQVASFPDWTTGQAFKGAIGSPVFDDSMRLVGIYLGGDGNCDQVGTERFASLASSWAEFEEYLDPLSIAPNNLEGIYPILSSSSHSAEDILIFFFPNPAREWIYVQNKSDNSISLIEIRDASGRLVDAFKPLVPTVDVSAMPEGIYSITFVMRDKRITQKLLVR